MTAAQLVGDLQAAGFELFERDGFLVIRRGRGRRLTNAERAELRALRDEVLACLRHPNGDETGSPPLSPMQRLEAMTLDLVRRRLSDPPCSCSSCATADVMARLQAEDRWRYY